MALRAEVHTLGGFSGHAGQDELLDWLSGQKRVRLVHGELPRLHALGKILYQQSVDVVVAQFAVPVQV